VEKGAQTGGSARLSAGMFWAPRDVQSAHETIPFGDPDLQSAFIKEHKNAVQWMRDNGVTVHDQFNGIMSIGIGFPISIPEFLSAAEKLINSSPNSRFLFSTSAVELTLAYHGSKGSRVKGAILRKPDGSFIEVSSRATLIATGGFQGSPQLVSQHIGPGADNIFVRSNSFSTGDGFKLAQQAGGGTSRGLSTFYGHLLPSPLQRSSVDPSQFIHLAQFQSGYSILINEQGKRFCDETFGDEVNNQELARQSNRRGFMILNEAIRQRYALSEAFPNAGKIDRLEKARSVGGRVARASTVNELISKIATWGVPPSTLQKTVQDYNSAVKSPKYQSTVLLDASIGGNGTPHKALVGSDDGPFWALEVQPSITFSYGGAKVDTKARTLTQDGDVIPGLYTAGIDGGGFSNWRYCGGLALAFVTGRWGAEAALKDCGLIQDRSLSERAKL
jgi:succinate dehydrogenase/fumarate reductase flavoprotein subunit